MKTQGYVPCGNQTWLAGKWTIEIGDFPIRTSIHRGFSIAMFDYQRVPYKKMAVLSMSESISRFEFYQEARLGNRFGCVFFWLCHISPCFLLVSHTFTCWSKLAKMVNCHGEHETLPKMDGAGEQRLALMLICGD